MRRTVQSLSARRAFDWKAERPPRRIPTRGFTLGPSSAAQVSEVLRRIRLFRRFQHIDLSLRPAVQEWVNKRARALAGQSAPDLEALRVSVRLRFSASFPSPLSPDPNVASGLEDESVACLVFLVLMMMVQDSENDLQAAMAQAEAAMSAKQLLRQLIEEVLEEEANILAGEAYVGGSLGQVTSSLFAASFDAQLTTLAEVTSVLQCPVEIAPVGPLTQESLASIANQLQDALDSMSEVSEMTSMQLQMLMDERSKLLETASDVEKTFGEAAEAIVGNIKQ